MIVYKNKKDIDMAQQTLSPLSAVLVVPMVESADHYKYEPDNKLT